MCFWKDSPSHMSLLQTKQCKNFWGTPKYFPSKSLGSSFFWSSTSSCSSSFLSSPVFFSSFQPLLVSSAPSSSLLSSRDKSIVSILSSLAFSSFFSGLRFSSLMNFGFGGERLRLSRGTKGPLFRLPPLFLFESSWRHPPLRFYQFITQWLYINNKKSLYIMQITSNLNVLLWVSKKIIFCKWDVKLDVEWKWYRDCIVF